MVDGVEGWLTDDQVAALHDAAAAVPDGGRIVEIGSFRGRSTIVLAAASAPSVSVVAIDPHAGNDRGPQQWDGFAEEANEDHERFGDNLRAAGVDDRVTHVRKFSDEAHGSVDGDIDLLFIDGAHRFGPARADIGAWGSRVVPGGRMLIHDSFSSVGVTLAVLATLLLCSDWRYEGRTGSLAAYRRRCGVAGAPTLSSRARQVAALGWFARNLMIKLLIVAHLGRLTRVLGHSQPTWPY